MSSLPTSDDRDATPTVGSAVALPERVPTERFFAALKELLGAPGPFVSFYLPVQDDRARGESLEAVASAPNLTTEQRSFARALLAVERAGDDAMIAAFVASDGSSLLQAYPEGPDMPLVEASPLPRLAPLIEAEQRLRHHLLAVVDDDGIDVLSFPRHGRATFHRAAPGDAAYTALLIAEAARQTKTTLVLIAAPDALSEELVRRVSVEVPIETRVHAISADEGAEALADRAVEHVANDRAVAAVESIRSWKFERSHGFGAAGVQDAVASLRTDEPRMLLIHEEADDDRQAWFGADPAVVALDLEDARMHFDPSAVRPGRLVDVAIRSAVLRDIPVAIVPSLPDETLPGGIGVLRSILPGS